MNLLSSWFGKKITLRDAGFWSAFVGGGSYAGKAVSADSAMQIATVWACVRLTAQAVSTLPLGMHEKLPGGGRQAAPDHPLAEVIGESPNADMTGLEFWEAVIAWLCTYGNAYAEIVRSGERVTALNLLPSGRTAPDRDPETDALTYVHVDRGKREVLPPEKVLHIKGFGFGGDLGLSPVRFGVQTLGTAIAADETAGRTLGAGMMPSGMLNSESVLTPEQRKQLAEVMAKWAGSSNAGKLMILEGGLKFEKITLDPEVMQLLETRRFHVEEICRWFGVPPIIVGHAAQGQTMWGSGVEAILIQWLTTGLNPWLTRIERRIRKQLIAPAERARFYAEFNREGLLQADSAAKAAFLSAMTQNGLMTRNEGRAKLNLPNKPGGDGLTAQTNLAPLDQLGAASDGQAARSAFRSWLGIEDRETARAESS